MGTRQLSRIYLDACAIIYLVEGAPPLQQAVQAKLVQYQATQLITARLSRLECRVLPLRTKNTGLLSIYDTFFSAARMTIGELTTDVVERATLLRADYNFKTPDALHLASGIEENADVFVTGDGQLVRCKEIRVEVV